MTALTTCPAAIMNPHTKLHSAHTVHAAIERQWFSVANGSLSEAEINDLCYQQMQTWDKIDQEYFQEDMLPRIEKCVDLAEKEKNIYFKNLFGVEV